MSNNKTGHLVCTGATCKCQFGNREAKLKVKTQTKHYINDPEASKKLMATHLEKDQPFEYPYFGLCKKTSNSPCAVSVTEWSKYYDAIKIETGGMPLLEGSKATCALGVEDCISITWHGQTNEVTKSDLRQTDNTIHHAINPCIDMDEFKDKINNTSDIIFE